MTMLDPKELEALERGREAADDPCKMSGDILFCLVREPDLRTLLALCERQAAEVERLRTLAENYGAEIAHMEQGIDLYKIGDIEQGRIEAEARADAAEARLSVVEGALEQWKCPSCGGRKVYLERPSGKNNYEGDPNGWEVPCKVCEESGLHPTALATLKSTAPTEEEGKSPPARCSKCDWDGLQHLGPCDLVPPDVSRLVVAARIVAHEDQGAEAINELDRASEAFASRVRWDDEPEVDPGPALPMQDVAGAEARSAVNDIIAERHRQIEVEGWTPQHDDNEHEYGELSRAAACYAAGNNRLAVSGPTRAGPGWSHIWPWQAQWWKPKDRRRNLVRAGALILAEIERLDRASLSTHPQDMAGAEAGWLPIVLCPTDGVDRWLKLPDGREVIGAYHNPGGWRATQYMEREEPVTVTRPAGFYSSSDPERMPKRQPEQVGTRKVQMRILSVLSEGVYPTHFRPNDTVYGAASTHPQGNEP